MYRVYIDYDHATKTGKIMHSPELASSGFVLIDPKCTRELNGAGELTFEIAKDHPYRYAFTRMKTIFTVVWVDDQYNETSMWQGRCYTDETDQYGTCTVTCEGEYAYLNDTFTFESDPDEVYDREEEDVRLPLWLYLAGLIAEHNVESLIDKQFMFDAIVDTVDICSSMADYIDYAGTWLQESGASVWAPSKNSGTYPLTSATWIHVYLKADTEGKYSIVSLIAVPPGMSEFQTYYGCDVEPKDDPTVELNITSHENHKSKIENLVNNFGGYMNVNDHWVHFERRTAWEKTYDQDTYPFRSPFVETEGVGTYMPVITYLREPGEYIEYNPLVFSEEITDLSVDVNCEDIVNVLIPKAEPVGEEGKSGYWDGTLKSVNDNVDYIKADTSVAMFGQLWGTNEWGEDVKDANTLMVRGISYLEEHMAPSWSVDMKVVDPAFSDPCKDALKYGNRYPVRVDPLDIETSFILIKEELNLVAPSKNEYEFYTTIGVFTDAELQNGGSDEYRMNADFATYRQNFIAAYSTETSSFYKALLAAMQSATAIPIQVAYGANRVDLDNTTYITATESVTWGGQEVNCNMYYCYPTVSPWCRNTPFGSASFILIVLYNSSSGHWYQVAFNPFSNTYILYREFDANRNQLKSSKKVAKTTNTRNWSPISGVNWPNPSSGTVVTGNITITQQPVDYTGAGSTNPSFTCNATGDGLRFNWYACKPGETKYHNCGTWTGFWTGGYTKNLLCKYTASTFDGYKVYCKITDSTKATADTNVAYITPP